MTTPRMGGAIVQPGTFLDSNILVRLFLLWDVCRSAGIRLDDFSEWVDLKSALKTATGTTTAMNRDDGEFVRLGLISFLRLSEGTGVYHYFTSRVCWSEVHHVLLEARGLEQLVLQGVPHSLRIKRPQMLYRVALERGDYVRLDADLDDFREALRLDYGLDVIDVEDPSAGFAVTSDDIWTAAQVVWSHVLMEVIDAYIYGAAVRIAADIFITADESLRTALGHLSRPQGDWVPLVASLKQALELSTDALLPQPIHPSEPLPGAHGALS